MRMIDADALAEFVHEYVLPQSPDGLVTKLAVLAAIDHKSITPTVQEPVRHGRWEGNETCDAYDVVGVKTWAVKRKCSVCRFVHKFIEAHMCYEFCPNCGAKMDGDGDA